MIPLSGIDAPFRDPLFGRFSIRSTGCCRQEGLAEGLSRDDSETVDWYFCARHFETPIILLHAQGEFADQELSLKTVAGLMKNAKNMPILLECWQLPTGPQLWAPQRVVAFTGHEMEPRSNCVSVAFLVAEIYANRWRRSAFLPELKKWQLR